MRPLRAALDLLFPPRCLGCDRCGAYLCAACRAGIHAVASPYCPACHNEVDSETPVCRCSQPAPLYAVAAGAYDGPLRRAVLGFKFQGRTAAAPTLAALMYLQLRALPLGGYLLVPVPLHAQRQRERGYNQAALLAHELSRLSGAPVAHRLLRRVRATGAQSLLSAAARKHNMEGAFLATAPCPGATVLLVDDVCTTGATLRAAAQAASAAGAKAVYAVVLAATSPDRSHA